jgi:hypothetical protein
VDDTREVLGIPLERLDLVEDFVRQICLDSITPPLTPVIERLTLPGTAGEPLPVLKLMSRAASCIEALAAITIVWEAPSEMAPDYLARLFNSAARRASFASTSRRCPALRSTTFQMSSGSVLSPRVQDTREVLLDKLAMARPDADGTLRPTIAGVLMASADPRRWLPNAFIQAVAYRGPRSCLKAMPPTSSMPKTSQDLDAQVLAACHFVRKNMLVSASKDEGRHDLPSTT